MIQGDAGVGIVATRADHRPRPGDQRRRELALLPDLLDDPLDGGWVATALYLPQPTNVILRLVNHPKNKHGPNKMAKRVLSDVAANTV